MRTSHLCRNSLNAAHLSHESRDVNLSRSACVCFDRCRGHSNNPRCLLQLRLARALTHVPIRGYQHPTAASFKEKYSKKLTASSCRSNINDQCILWTGSYTTNNLKRYGDYGNRYGSIFYKRGTEWKRGYVHRLSYMFSRDWDFQQMNHGGFMHTSHLCHNSLCINADHLSYESNSVNLGRVACVSGGRC